MVHPVLEAVLVRLAQRSTPSGPAPRPGTLRLVGDLQRVSALATVSEGTTAVLFPRPGPAELLPAGTVVLPALLPASAAAYLVVSHRPVSLDLSIGPLGTVDDRTLEAVSLRLQVEVTDPPTGLLALATEHSAALEAELLHRLQAEVTSQVTSAVRMNRLADLERLSLAGVLEDGWLGSTFLGGLLRRTDLHVLDVTWPTEVEASAAAPRPRRAR